MNTYLLLLFLFIAGLASQIILLQINLLRWHKKNPDASLVRSKFIFKFEDVDDVILPDLNEGMLLSSTILFSYIYLQYFVGIFSSHTTPNVLNYIIPSFVTTPLPYLITFFFILSMIIGAFHFKLPSFLKFICYLWFLLCSIALLIFFTVKVYMYFDSPPYIYQDPITIYFVGFNIIPLLTYLISLRWLFPNKNKSVIMQIGMMIEKVEDKQLSWQRTLLTVGLQGGILLLNAYFHIMEDAGLIGLFVATMPLIHYKPRFRKKSVLSPILPRIESSM